MSRYPKFFEYMNARGGTDEKAKVDVTGDQIDMPTPKAKDDPHKRNKKKKGGKQPQVSEYLNASGKLVEKPLVDMKADYKGPDPSSPPGKDSTPYRAANSGAGKSGSAQSGLGDMGYKNLKYQPNTNTETGDKVVSSWPKTKTEQFIAQTRGMSTAEFSQYMIEAHGCKHVDFIKAVKYVADLANHNDSLMGNFVHEVKNTGGIGKLLRTILTQPEAFDELQELFGEKRAKSLRRTMNKQILEGVSPPIKPDGLDDDDDMEDDDMEMSDLDNDMDDMDDEDLDDEGFGDDELGDEPQLCPHCGKDINEPPEDDDELGGDFPLGGDDDLESELGDEDFEDDMDDEEDMDMGLDDEEMDLDDDEDDMDDDDLDLDDEDDEDEDDEIGSRKKKFGDMLGGAMDKMKM